MRDEPLDLIAAAIRRVEESRDSHVQWRDHLDACSHCREHPPQHVHGRDEQVQIIAEYDVVLEVLRRA